MPPIGPPPPAIVDMCLADLLAGIASTEPSPGAGAAGAIALALGIACARKAVRISAMHHPADVRLRTTDERLSVIGQIACVGADEDASAFAALLAALKMPHDDPEQTVMRDTAVQTHAVTLVASGERLVTAGIEVEAVLAAVGSHIDPVIANDVAAAHTLIAAARAIATVNMAENRRLL